MHLSSRAFNTVKFTVKIYVRDMLASIDVVDALSDSHAITHSVVYSLGIFSCAFELTIILSDANAHSIGDAYVSAHPFTDVVTELNSDCAAAANLRICDGFPVPRLGAQ